MPEESWVDTFCKQYDAQHGPYDFRHIYEVDEELFAYADALQAESKRRERTMEKCIRIKDDQCLVNRVVLQPGTPLEITPVPGLWLPGHYGYDPDHQEHYWKADDEHFVGLIDGMKVRIQG